MKESCKESRLGRFSHLLRGSTRARRHHAFMIALVLVALLSFAGVVSADDYWKGYAPTTANGTSGTVNGSVDVLFGDTWKTENPVDYDDAWANLTLAETPSASKPLQFARLYVTVYTANMTDNWKGNFSVTLKDGTYSAYAYPVVHKALDLDYDRTSGETLGSVSGSLLRLSRVTSDYVATIDVKDTLQNWGNPDIRIHVETWNESVRLQEGLTRFDGRIKEVKLVYGWNDTSSTTNTKYWINEDQDPITKNMGTYTGNKTWFNGTGTPRTYTAKLWVNYLSNSSSSTSTVVGYGRYWWNTASHNLSYGCSGTGCYPPTVNKGYYAGLLNWTWTQSSSETPGNQNNDVLMYSNTSAWYKIPLAIFTIK